MRRLRGPSQSRSAAHPRGGPLGSRPIGSGERPRGRHAAGIGGFRLRSAVMEGVTVVDHVLLQRLVSILRDRDTPHGNFRQTLDDAGMILAYEAMRSLRTDEVEVETPLEGARGVRLADEVVIVAILRAGLGLVDGFLRLVPDARVGHLGMYRDEEALRPVGYYENIPTGVEDAEVFVVDPMLATGGSS